MKKINFLLITLFLTTSCGSFKEAGKVLRNEKQSSTDEFLVKKREPLILPPEYDKIPEPNSDTKSEKEKNDENIKQSVLANDNFVKQPQYDYLKRAFKDSKYYENGWKWHQLVRVILEPQENRIYMYDRLLSLLLKHKRSYDDYFTLRTEEGLFQVPNPLADLNKLEIMYQKYFQMYKNITNQMFFIKRK